MVVVYENFIVTLLYLVPANTMSKASLVNSHQSGATAWPTGCHMDVGREPARTTYLISQTQSHAQALHQTRPAYTHVADF